MDKFLERLEEYNIFNYLLPGIIFTYILKHYVGVDIFQKNIIEMAFIYYFIGSVISRIGSILLEPFLRKIKFLTYVSHKDYVDASKEDEVIEKLSMVNNMYRTLCSSLIILIILRIAKVVIEYFKLSQSFISTTIIIIGIILYLFSYRKQTKYIVSRVERIKNRENK